MKTFGLLGAAGYIAPRHIDAIHANGGKLVWACDPNDAVGVLDRHSRDVQFFHKPVSSFDPPAVDYWSIATPNDLHSYHAIQAMKCGADAVLEKPVALSSVELADMLEVERETGRKVHPMLQLRAHPEVIRRRAELAPDVRHTASIRYITPRGPWYAQSWKGDESRSGGIVANIGVHLFDLLLHLFGKPTHIDPCVILPTCAWGILRFDNAIADWQLSIADEKPERTIHIDGEPLNLSDRFTELHGEVYRRILAGDWYGLADAAPAVRLCEEMRSR